MLVDRKIFFCIDFFSKVPSGGPRLRQLNCLMALSKQLGQNLVIYTKGIEYQDFSESFDHLQNIGSVQFGPLLRICKYRPVRRLIRQFVPQLWVQALDAWWLSKKHIGRSVDRFVWVSFANLNVSFISTLRVLDSGVRIVADTDSVWSRFLYRELRLRQSGLRRVLLERSARLSRKGEARLVHMSHVVTAVSDVDADYYRSLRMDPIDAVEIFPNVIEPTEYVSKTDYSSTGRLLIVGTGGGALENGISWFLSNVYPLIQERIDVKLDIVGRGTEALKIPIDDSVLIHGEVDSVQPFAHGSDVMIVPLTIESGTRFKILEAGLWGIPVVSTVLGAEGLVVQNNRDIFIADRPSEFARHVVSLMENEHARMCTAENLFRLVSTCYTKSQLDSSIKRVIDRLQQP